MNVFTSDRMASKTARSRRSCPSRSRNALGSCLARALRTIGGRGTSGMLARQGMSQMLHAIALLVMARCIAAISRRVRGGHAAAEVNPPGSRRGDNAGIRFHAVDRVTLAGVDRPGTSQERVKGRSSRLSHIGPRLLPGAILLLTIERRFEDAGNVARFRASSTWESARECYGEATASLRLPNLSARA